LDLWLGQSISVDEIMDSNTDESAATAESDESADKSEDDKSATATGILRAITRQGKAFSRYLNPQASRSKTFAGLIHIAAHLFLLLRQSASHTGCSCGQTSVLCRAGCPSSSSQK
jgi:hypothetical protein